MCGEKWGRLKPGNIDNDIAFESMNSIFVKLISKSPADEQDITKIYPTFSGLQHSQTALCLLQPVLIFLLIGQIPNGSKDGINWASHILSRLPYLAIRNHIEDLGALSSTTPPHQSPRHQVSSSTRRRTNFESHKMPLCGPLWCVSLGGSNLLGIKSHIPGAFLILLRYPRILDKGHNIPNLGPVLPGPAFRLTVAACPSKLHRKGPG